MSNFTYESFIIRIKSTILVLFFKIFCRVLDCIDVFEFVFKHLLMIVPPSRRIVTQRDGYQLLFRLIKQRWKTAAVLRRSFSIIVIALGESKKQWCVE